MSVKKETKKQFATNEEIAEVYRIIRSLPVTYDVPTSPNERFKQFSALKYVPLKTTYTDPTP